MNNIYIHPSSYVDEGAVLGENTKVWHFCHIMPSAIVGNNCNIGQNVVIMSHVKIGNNVKIQNNVSIYEGVECEDDVFLGPSMVFTNVYNPRSAVARKNEYRKTLVKKGCSIGANATIICGITLGAYSFISAGAVVTHDVPAYALVMGIPAHQHGWMSEYGNKLIFDDTHHAICSESNQVYFFDVKKATVIRIS